METGINVFHEAINIETILRESGDLCKKCLLSMMIYIYENWS
jgi:hypothetical protein